MKCINWDLLVKTSVKFTLGLTNIITLTDVISDLHIPSNTICISGSTLIKSVQEREKDENADSDDDNDGYRDIPEVFWCKLIKNYLFAAQCSGHLSSSKDSCNHPFCLPAPSVFPLPCIRINLSSFILIVSYLLNWQSQWRTIETQLILKMSQSKFFLCSCSFLKELSYFSVRPKESLNTMVE